MLRPIALALCLTVTLSSAASAQTLPDGYVSLTLDTLPNSPEPATELRARLFVEEKGRPFERLTLHVAGFLEGLVRDGSTGAIVRPQELYAELAGSRADLRLGYSRIVWGRLDEVQPTDVVNPLDLARFFFEGRAEARIAVPLVRGRLFFGERATVEAIAVPFFTRGRFDQLDEESSPFNLESGRVVCLGIGVCPPLEVEVNEPANSLSNMQGGGRVSVTTGRVDWSASVYRGFQPFGVYTVLPPDPLALTQRLFAERTFPRFTMIGGDFETARGAWAVRGEIAYTESELPATSAAVSTPPESDRRVLDAGAGFDRKAGEYRVSGTVLVRHDSTDSYTSTSLVVSADRSFARERYRTRSFLVYNAKESVAFLRNITSVELRDNVALEGSIGWFFGEAGDAARDVISGFADRDFLYARLRVYF